MSASCARVYQSVSYKRIEKNMINYSIIIPHKNSQELLAYCLATIPVRDDVQVIVVDDNSDATKVDFEHFPKWEGKHFEYYLTKEGKGAGYARNVGLEHAEGTWVLFVDADDYMQPCVGKIFDREVNTDADIIYFRPKAVMLKDRTEPSYRMEYYNDIINEYQRTGDETRLRVRFYSPTCKFIRMSMIRANQIRFEETRYSNDNYFSAHIGCCAKKVVVRDDNYYMVTQGENTLVSDFCKKEGERETRADVIIRTSALLKKYGYEVDFKAVSTVISPFLFTDKRKYRHYIKALLEQGYSKWYLTKNIFNSPKWKARTWRRAYSLCATCGL